MKLPKYVQAWIDGRDDRAYYYYRRRGFPSVRLPGLPWSPTFMAAYEAALTGPRTAIGTGRIKPGSVAAVVADYEGTGPLHRRRRSSAARPQCDDADGEGGHPMIRRDFIALLGGAAAWPLAARGQEPGRIYRLGCLLVSPRDASHHVALFDELRRLGFIEGQNLVVDAAGYSLSPERMDVHATDLINGRVDVILAAGDAAVRAAQRATASIPILAFTDDMLGQGFVRSLGQPGGNITGVTLLASELDGKRQEILIEAVPGVRRIAALVDSNTTMPSRLRALEEAAHERGVELSIHQVAMREEVASAIDAAKAADAGALNVLASSLLFNSRAFILSRVATLRLPAIYQWPEMAEQGGLIGYGPLIVQLYRDIMSRQLAKLLRGVKPTDLPVGQPTRFQLVINMKTAKALGITVPAALLARADEVIE